MTLPGSMCMRGSGGQALCKSGGLRAKAILLVLALIVSGMSGLSYAQSGDDALTELRRLKSADPVADADRAVSAGDTRLLGLAGFTLEVPGASERDRAASSDVFHGSRQRRIPPTQADRYLYLQ